MGKFCGEGGVANFGGGGVGGEKLEGGRLGQQLKRGKERTLLVASRGRSKIKQSREGETI